jgi:hypothetical protein
MIRTTPREDRLVPSQQILARNPRRFSGSGGIACPTTLKMINNTLYTQTFFWYS